MTNRDHLLAETPEANLGKGMRQRNDVDIRRFNDVHWRCRHVFEGRDKAIFAEKETYLTELAR